MLNKVAGLHTSKVGSAAANDDDMFNVAQFIIAHVETAEARIFLFRQYAAGQCGGEAGWLFINFFGEEMVKALLLNRLHIHVEHFDLDVKLLRFNCL